VFTFEKKTVDGRTQFRMVATDGHRFSLVDRFTTDDTANIINTGVIIPRKGLAEVKKLSTSVTSPFKWLLKVLS
jgi:DNA polymerase-3 subunit beta